MNNTMISISKYIVSHYAAFGLQSHTDLLLTSKTKNRRQDDETSNRWLIMLAMRTVSDNSRAVTFGNLIAEGIKAERFLTQIEFECKTRGEHPEQEFYWNDARVMRDMVYNSLAGTNRGGITIPRYDWSCPEEPIPAGEIWFEVDPERGTPIEDPIEDQDDPRNKTIFLTYNVHWWRPVS